MCNCLFRERTLVHVPEYTHLRTPQKYPAKDGIWGFLIYVYFGEFARPPKCAHTQIGEFARGHISGRVVCYTLLTLMPGANLFLSENGFCKIIFFKA